MQFLLITQPLQLGLVFGVIKGPIFLIHENPSWATSNDSPQSHRGHREDKRPSKRRLSLLTLVFAFSVSSVTLWLVLHGVPAATGLSGTGSGFSAGFIRKYTKYPNSPSDHVTTRCTSEPKTPLAVG